MKYKETQHLRQWDLLALIGGFIVIGFIVLFQVMMAGQPNKNILLVLALAILILSGLFYYFNTIRVTARYNEKNIKLSMLPVGTVKRKIRWEDVASSEIVNLPPSSTFVKWNSLFSSLNGVITRNGNTCLQLT
ncbi:MAG: hypothetical protein M3R25_11635, partial [Bacteroidota bacterium]|nr:hypothetical protein [Bacteroidota bacterium]